MINRTQNTCAIKNVVNIIINHGRFGSGNLITYLWLYVLPDAVRFAIRYHRELRRKDAMKTGLEDVPGIGRKRQEALLDRFRTLEKIRAANIEELSEVIGKNLALRLQQALEKRPAKKI